MRMPDDSALQQVKLALANAKRVEREANVVVVTLARLRDELSRSKEDAENHADPARSTVEEHRSEAR